MTFENIIRKYGKVPRQDAYNMLDQLANSLFNDKWKYGNKRGSETKFNKLEKDYKTEITEKWLLFECDETECNKAAVVLAVQHMYHEQRHIQYAIDEWNKTNCLNSIKSVQRTTDIVRRNVVGSFYFPIYAYNYPIDPEEMDTEAYSLRKGMSHFELTPLCSLSKEILITQKDAENILIDVMLSDDYGHKPELNNYFISNINELINAFEDLRDKAIHEPYTMKPREDGRNMENIQKTELDMTEDFLKLPVFQSFLNEFNASTDAVEMDKILEQTIVLRHPDVSQYVPRLYEEFKKCEKQMRSRFFTSRYKVIPATKINYAGEMLDSEETFANAVNEISVTEKSPETEFADAVNDLTEKENEYSLKYY